MTLAKGYLSLSGSGTNMLLQTKTHTGKGWTQQASSALPGVAVRRTQQRDSNIRKRHLSRQAYVLQNLDSLCLALILGEGEQLARGLSHFIEEGLFSFQEGFPVIWQVLPDLHVGV